MPDDAGGQVGFGDDFLDDNLHLFNVHETAPAIKDNIYLFDNSRKSIDFQEQDERT